MVKPEHPGAADELATLPLTSLNWIDRLPPPVRCAVRNKMRTRSIRTGEHIWLSGQVRTGIVQIISGKIRFYSGNADGRELRYITCSAGDCLGEDSLSGLDRRHHSTTAEVPTTIATLSVDDFWELAGKWPVIHYEFYRLYAYKSKFLFDYIDSIVLHSADVQIAGRICSILAARGEASSQEPGLTISHSGLADMIGASRQTVSTVLQRWRNAGLVSLRYRKLLVLKPEVIRAIWESRQTLQYPKNRDDYDWAHPAGDSPAPTIGT